MPKPRKPFRKWFPEDFQKGYPEDWKAADQDAIERKRDWELMQRKMPLHNQQPLHVHTEGIPYDPNITVQMNVYPPTGESPSPGTK